MSDGLRQTVAGLLQQATSHGHAVSTSQGSLQCPGYSEAPGRGIRTGPSPISKLETGSKQWQADVCLERRLGIHCPHYHTSVQAHCGNRMDLSQRELNQGTSCRQTTTGHSPAVLLAFAKGATTSRANNTAQNTLQPAIVSCYSCPMSWHNLALDERVSIGHPCFLSVAVAEQ